MFFLRMITSSNQEKKNKQAIKAAISVLSETARRITKPFHAN